MHLLRRDRLVVGGPGKGYESREILGAPNSFQAQRLVAELDLNDSPVTQTKTAFDWAGDLENEFVDGLHEVTSDYVEKCQTVVSDEPPRPSKSDGEAQAIRRRTSLRVPTWTKPWLSSRRLPTARRVNRGRSRPDQGDLGGSRWTHLRSHR